MKDDLNPRKPMRPLPPRKKSSGDDEGNINKIMRQVLVWLVVIFGIVLLFMVARNGGAQPVQVSYNVYQQLLNDGAIESAVVNKSGLSNISFKGELKKIMPLPLEDGRTVQGKSISTKLLVVDSQTEQVWMHQGIKVYYENEESEWWGPLVSFLPWILLIGIWLFFFRRMQGAGTKGIFSFGKSRARLLSETSPRVTFADVAGADEAKEELQEIVEFLREPGKFQRLGGKIPRGVLLLGPPGTGKCVVGETLVLTDKGLIEIKDIPKYFWVDPSTNEVSGAWLPTVDLDTVSDTRREASHWYSLGAQPTLRVTLKQGMMIEGTYEHPIVVMAEDGSLQFRELARLNEGDSVAVKYNTGVFGHLREVDPDEAYLMGLMTGDGNMSSSNRVELTTADQEIREFFHGHMHDRYGEELNVGIKSDGITHVVSSWRVKKDLVTKGLTTLLSFDKCLPDTILQAPKDVVVAFLQGLFDADGYFQRYCFGYSTVSKKMADQVTAMLLNLGIVPRLRVKSQVSDTHPHEVYEIIVSGTSLPRFAEEVGFRLPRKRQQLEEYLAGTTAGVNTNVDLFTNITPLVLECWSELRDQKASASRLASLIDKVRDRGRISRNALKEFVDVCREKGLSSAKLDYLAQLAAADLFFSPVANIQQSFANVYDFTVPGTHSFISNGFISHNTLLARAVAGEASVQYLSISGADFVEMFVGVGASRVRDLFEQAKKIAPAIIFIDEIDAVGRQRGAGLGGGHDEREQTLNALLVEMDGFEQNVGVIIIAATNRPDVLDPALLRPGRFDRQVMVDRPDRRGREAILKVHTRNIPIAENVDLGIIAKATPGFSGADLANLANEAAIFAARRNGDKVTMYDFEMAKDKLIMGLERRTMVMTEEERKMTAYHEVGHVLVAKFMPHADPVHKVTIIPRGRALGVTAFLPNDDMHSHSREWFEARIAMALGGRAAELLIFGNYTSGAQGDIKMITMLARQMVCELGMSETLGPINYASSDGEVFLGRDFTTHRDISEATSEMIDKEIRRLVDEGMKQAMAVLNEHINILHTMSALLLERETLDSEEIDMVISGEDLPSLEVKRMLQARMASGNSGSSASSNSGESATPGSASAASSGSASV